MSLSPEKTAQLIRDAFEAFQARFRMLTRRAPVRFAQRDWHGMRKDAAERLSVYREIVDGVEAHLRTKLGDRVHERELWSTIRTAYSDRIGDRADAELAETFYNSITRRIFDTVGVDPKIEFVTTDVTTPRRPPQVPVMHVFERQPTTEAYVDAILRTYAFRVPYADRVHDARRTGQFIDECLHGQGVRGRIGRVELARPVFYRGITAYVVGRLYAGSEMVPFALAFHNTEVGVKVDAVLVEEDDISILFSFARSYFQVDVPHPHALVRFLSQMLPEKRIAELYISIGYNKHGKTELYRDLLRHFAETDDTFARAPGKRGMVMTVFTMASYNMVFKIIRDTFDPPKTATRSTVKERYHMVFKHDRAGRLVDAQEFEHLRLSRRLFSDALLDELTDIASKTVRVQDGRVVIEHCYVERRVTPLDLFVRDEPFAKAKAALLEYGNAIKDLARTNIFPGDLLLKNFGVTRHGRVVFYDYDELGFVEDYTFRTKPQARSYLDELSADAWFYVGPDDVFPEEFKVTMGISDALMAAFETEHADLFTADYWNGVKKRIDQGEFIPILPYPPQDRLPHRRHIANHELRV